MNSSKPDWNDDNVMEVGNVVGTDKHFIAVQLPYASKTTSLSGTKWIAVHVDRDDIPWLIRALQKELRLVKTAQAEAK